MKAYGDVIAGMCTSTYVRVGKFFFEMASKKIISALQATWSVSQLLNYAIMAKRQPQTMSK